MSFEAWACLIGGSAFLGFFIWAGWCDGLIQPFTREIWRGLRAPRNDDGSLYYDKDREVFVRRIEGTPWTPAEREAFGVNDTERFIRETQQVLDTLSGRSGPEQTLNAGGITTGQIVIGPRRMLVHATDPEVPDLEVWTGLEFPPYDEAPRISTEPGKKG